MTKNILIVAVVVCVALAVWFFGKKGTSVSDSLASPEVTPTPMTTGSPVATVMASASPETSASPAKTLKGGLIIQDLVVGIGAEAVNGKKLSVHYVGTLQNGTKFDSSVDRGQPFSFTIGAGEVIQGWDEGVLGMKVGGKRKLVIPAALGYGARGAGSMIPPNATLIFEVQLLGVN